MLDMGESRGVHDRHNSLLDPTRTSHDDLAYKHRSYRQMAMLVHDLQGTGADRSLASDEDDNCYDIKHLAARKNYSMPLSLRPAMSEAIARGDSKLLKRLVAMCERMSHRGQGHSGAKVSLSSIMAEVIDAKRLDMLGILLEGKASASDSHKGQCHLARAVKTGNYDMVLRLVEAGADVNAEVDNKSILHIAASMSSTDVIKCLLEKGSCLETKDQIQGNTALHIACSYCNVEAARVLIQYGAEFNCRNFHGDSPLAKLLRHITKNKQDWHNSKSLKLAQELIETGLMIFPSDKFTIADDQKHGRRSKESHHHSALTTSTSSSDFPTMSTSSSLARMCSNKNSKTLTTHNKCTTSSSYEMFLSLVQSLEEFDADNENMDEFPVLSSSSSSSSLSSSSSSSLSSCESPISFAEDHEVLDYTSSPDRSSSCPWWKKKETKMFQLYDKILMESRTSWSLHQHCRLRVLRCLGTRPLKSSVAALCLPQMVRRYILYGNLATFDMNS